MKSDTFAIPRAGREIFVRRWSPDGPPRACLQIAHGLEEHSGRYARLADALTDARYTVYANDHRGHGPSCQPADLGYFADANGWRECLDDMHAVSARMGAEHPMLPRAFLGHSMGSFLGQAYLSEHGGEFAAAALSGSNGPPPPIIGLGREIAAFESWRLGPRGKSPLVRALLFGEFNKPFKPTRTDFDWLSRDPLEVDKYIGDPFCGFGSTNQLALDLLGALPGLTSRAAVARIPKSLPIYIFSGARDPVGPNLQRLIDIYGAAGLRVTAKIYPEARHETLNETNRDEVTGDLIAWLAANVR